MRKVRTLRHWKQQFSQNAAFVWRKSITFGGKQTVPGERAEGIKPTKLRAFWEAGMIELAEFEEPRDVLEGRNHPEDEAPEGDQDETPDASDDDGDDTDDAEPESDEGNEEDDEGQSDEPAAEQPDGDDDFLE